MPISHLAGAPDHHLVRVKRHVLRQLLIAHNPQPSIAIHRHPQRHQIAALRVEIFIRLDDRHERARSHVEHVHPAALRQHIDSFFPARQPRAKLRQPRHLAEREARRSLRQWPVLRRFQQLRVRLELRLHPPRRDLFRRESARLIPPRIPHESQHRRDLRIVQNLRRHHIVVLGLQNRDCPRQPLAQHLDRPHAIRRQPVALRQRRVHRRRTLPARLMTQRALFRVDFSAARHLLRVRRPRHSRRRHHEHRSENPRQHQARKTRPASRKSAAAPAAARHTPAPRKPRCASVFPHP